MTNLQGKVAVVTGAGRGVGRQAALRLASLGAGVALIARSAEQLRETAALIEAAGGRAVALPMDLTRQLSPDDLREVAERALGPPAILVNAAGIFGPIAQLRDTDPKAWIETLMVNMVSPYVTCRAFVGAMIDAKWGRIINVSSAASLLAPGPVDSAYGTSKAALNQFTRHLASELAGTGVTANVIHPGDVKTDMWAEIQRHAERLGPEAAAYKDWAAWVETTGGDDPDKAADLIAHIVSDEARTVSGQFLWIENGLRRPIPSW
ncbi:MAG TPA: SDR family oxidoreductase [Nordella sp.]|nr:SDR family oxidoreductase [Nordella sp.]